MKAVSPLSLEPRGLLWLLEVEEAKRAAAQDSPVCVPSGSSRAFWSSSVALRLIPQPATQPPHSVDGFRSGWCDIL